MMTRSASRLLKMQKELPTLSARLKRILSFALPIESHIDHVFISPKVAVDGIQTVQFPGSDHKGYSFDMQQERLENGFSRRTCNLSSDSYI